MTPVIWTFVLLWSIPLTTGGDTTVTCVFTADCLLPCQSPYHNTVKWYKVGKENAVYTFDNNEDHLEHQDVDFKGRTSLFADQIPRGNASLLLRSIRTVDEGTYLCYTSAGSEALKEIVRLDVKAPIKRVDIKYPNGEITCNTSDVYPEPIISWYDNHHNLQTNFTTETQKDEQGLFSLTSTLTYEEDEESDTNRDVFVTCSISFEDKSQNYTTSLKLAKEVDIYSGQDANIQCPVSRGDAGDYTITLRFGESSIILSQLANISEQLAGIDVRLARHGDVTLHNLDMYKHTGTYTCEMFTAQSTTQVVLTSVHIISDIHNFGIAEAFGASLTITVIVSLVIYCFCRLYKKRTREDSRENRVIEEVEEELEPLSGENPSNGRHSPSGSVHTE
ncbi:hypothetical protein AMELA_G00221020 [Ameiurus melas]|uniref:Ig-like domain-containing protein n=1 Tax=Ameiurus melas TaxID=219545 RepID=A0A7J6A126_AMEME|nr:hypothetical protein AMELA_G00221020 [Ameiurus melas]